MVREVSRELRVTLVDRDAHPGFRQNSRRGVGRVVRLVGPRRQTDHRIENHRHAGRGKLGRPAPRVASASDDDPQVFALRPGERASDLREPVRDDEDRDPSEERTPPSRRSVREVTTAAGPRRIPLCGAAATRRDFSS